jgi:hypothetical protein
MALKRDVLKQKFRNGSRPTEKDFNTFIDSSIILEDDGIEFTDNGLKLTKRASSIDESTAYQIQFGDTQINNLQFSYAEDAKSTLLLGINQQGISTNQITVDGDAVLRGRQGNFTQANVDAPPHPKKTTPLPVPPNPLSCDGTWQTILYTKKICQAYEIVAQLDGMSKSVLVAIASTSESAVIDKNTDKRFFLTKIVDPVANLVKRLFNITNTKVNKTQCYSDWLSGRIKIKWVENYNSYSLQVKADVGDVYYSITQLWGDNYIARK